jgi:hypothetical protein
LRRPGNALAALAAVLLGLGAASCHNDGDAVLVLVVTAAGSPMSVASLEVTLNGPAGRSTVPFNRDDQRPITFPTTLTAVVPARATGQITIDVRALGPTGEVLATGHEGPLTVKTGDRQTIFVELDCGGGPCVVDGGTSAGRDGGTGTGGPSCGNGRVDPTETCDTAIAPGDPGACPPADCSDGIPCTRDVASGDGCTLSCTHTEITASAPGDFCCPAGATSADDSDCAPACGDDAGVKQSGCCGDGVVDAHETCDVAIAVGLPGACPTQADCDTGDLCSRDWVVSDGTCSAVCAHERKPPKSDPKDQCCPPGATKGVDSDCPVVCGDGIVESPIERCDPGIPAGNDGACPVACASADACKPTVLTGAGCQAACVPFPITDPISGDGCCLKDKNGVPLWNHAQDTDCPGSCGDGVLEPGEACDNTAPPPFSCPTGCQPPASACLQADLVGTSDDCSARCVITTVTACSVDKDGCCPKGCTALTDPDCSPACGDGLLQRSAFGEVCDTAIRSGPGVCPTSCASSDPCIEERLLSAGTCSAACVPVQITEPRAGDGCCPFGANATIDSDCAPACNNGVVESSERCDIQIKDQSGQLLSCPATCPAAGSCAVVELQAAGTCGAACVTTPITGCSKTSDGCCPAGCTALTDSDCPIVCGDGIVETGETCDRGITAGMPGSCPRTCDDGDACTLDVAVGSADACTRTCAHVAITTCLGGDGCCPSGCTGANDSDCSPRCGDGRIGAGETCDPPGTCPTTCRDDGDPCTRERLDGDPLACTAVCRHDPITTCSGSTSDACCPTGCSRSTDTDC